jgi:hypothetical protein
VSALSDAQIAAMSQAEHRQLIRRLERPIRMWLLEPSTPLWRLPLLP